MIVLHKEGASLENVAALEFWEDAVRIEAGHTQVVGLHGRDTLPCRLPELRNKAHRDYIQLLPRIDGIHNQQYCGARLDNVSIRDCWLRSPDTRCQGVFASDGLFSNLNIFFNRMDLGSQHKISINGLLSGWIADNRDSQGNLLPIMLQPLRLLGGFNVWIIGFKDCEHYYQPLNEIVHDATFDHVTDHRRRITRPGDMHLTDFDMAAFTEDARSVKAPDAQTLCEQLYSRIQDYGRRVYSV